VVEYLRVFGHACSFSLSTARAAPNPELELRGDAMPHDTLAPNCLPSDSPHPAEVRSAQVAVDEVGKCARSASAPGSDAAVDLELLRGLVTMYGADGVRRMIGVVEVSPPGVSITS
jgi:hypothetical protein